MSTKIYLGDSVYADYDGYHIVLTTENDDYGPSNIICLEPPVLQALNEYVERLATQSQKTCTNCGSTEFERLGDVERCAVCGK